MLSPSAAARTRVGAAVVVPILVGLALAAGTIAAGLSSARSDTDSQVRALVAQTVVVVRTEVRNQLSAATAGTQSSSRLVPARDIAGGPMSLAAAITARDGGAATLDNIRHDPSIVVPVYRGAGTPASTSARRAAIVAFRIVPLVLRPLLIQLDNAGAGLVVRGPGSIVASYPGPPPSDAHTFAVDMDMTGSPDWDVEAWQADPGVPAVAWFWAGGLLLLFAGLGAGAGVYVRRHERSAARLRALEHDRALVTGLAPVLQASLDIGEVVPAVSSHLGTILELRGISLSTPDGSGERPLFVWGDSPDASVPARATGVARIEAGETFAVALTRGGRALGTLRVVAGRVLDADSLASLATAAELLGSMLANAEAFAQQEELLDRMRSLDELKTVFLATASHELRTPVTAIVGFSTLLVEQGARMPEGRAQTLIGRIKVNGERLETLIEQLLDFSRLERGLPQPGDELLNLAATVVRILDDQPELVGDHELDIVLDEECLVRGSSTAVERIVTNLVGNAAKYSPAGTRITVTVRPEGDSALVLVDDEGAGVPEEDRSRIFSRFFRGRGDAVTRTRGAGIGLAIVAEYAATMSGSVTVQSAPSGGARFCVAFPSIGTVSRAVLEGKIDVAHT